MFIGWQDLESTKVGGSLGRKAKQRTQDSQYANTIKPELALNTLNYLEHPGTKVGLRQPVAFSPA